METYSHTIPDLGDVMLQWHREAHASFVDTLELQRNTSVYDLKGLLPKSWEWRVVASRSYMYLSYSDGRIKGVAIRKPVTLDDIAGILHEIGHAQNCEEQSPGNLKEHWDARNRWVGPDEFGLPTLQDIYDVLEDECRAWNFAVQEFWKMSITNSTMQQIYEHIVGNESLGSYVYEMVTAVKHKGVELPRWRKEQEIVDELLQKYNHWLKRITGDEHNVLYGFFPRRD